MAFLILFLFIIEEIYFKVANHFNITDKPNQRSSHSEITIRGGGIIFWFTAIFYYFYSEFEYHYFMIGLSIISMVSFLDDIYTLPNKYRLPFHFIVAGLILFQLNNHIEPFLIVVPLLIIIVGILNAYNFMDGINGITGGYSLIIILSLLDVNNYILPFVENDFLYCILASLIVFIFYNFRKKAICFAGDVGSISIATIIIFLILELISKNNQFIFILFLAVYGVDSILTIIKRILNKENIFKAHNTHLYQLLVSKLGYSHIKVTIIYMSLQLILNYLVIIISKNTIQNQIIFSFTSISILVFTYLRINNKVLKISKN